MEAPANNTLNLAGTFCQDGIRLVEQKLSEAVGSGEGVLREMCEHIAHSGGKRIRPQLVLGSGLAFCPLNSRMVDAAVASELIHMASLVHDDIIDLSPLRRNKPSINALWGNHAAVLCGDWLFAQAFGMLSEAGMGRCMRTMVDAIQAMCHGEVLQAMNKHNLAISADTYYGQIVRKTARLMECCCKSGAAAGGAGSRAMNALGRYGLNLGLAFQIIDDILDFEGSAAKMGKPKGEDLRQGILTLPVILLLQDERYGAQAREALAGKKFSDGAVDMIQELLKASGAIGRAYTAAGSFLDKAMVSLAGLPDSESKAMLCTLASDIKRREN